MNVLHLILREILYRKLNFALGVLSVLVAVGCLVGELTLLRKFDLRTSEIVAAKEAETQVRVAEVEKATQKRMSDFEKETGEKMAALQRDTAQRMQKLKSDTAQRMTLLEDDFRKITKNLGFNVLILPKDQNLSDLYADDFASKYMPEEYADRLARASIATINHLLPILQQKLKWPEQERTIIVIGTRGEVPIVNRDPKKPILDAVPTGSMIVGYELHRNLKLKVGDTVKLMGRTFTVLKLHPERGTKDDITVWINLDEAQEMFNRQGQINALQALECNCSADRLEKIREEIATVLPNTQVIEFASQALARAEARNRAKAEASAALAQADAQAAEELREAANHAESERRRTAAMAETERRQAAALAVAEVNREKAHRAQMRQEQESYAAFLIPVVVAGCIVWLGVLTFSNVRDRSSEIGILRALGLKSRQVLALFLGKAILMGFVGAALGCALGVMVATFWGESLAPGVTTRTILDPLLLVLVVVAAPILCALAGWVPALLAARQDPAAVLREA